MNLRAKGTVMIVIWITYVFLLLNFFEDISETIANSNFIVAFIFYLMGNPIYMLTIYSVWKLGKRLGRAAWKRAVASILVIIGADAVTLPRLAIDTSLVDGSTVTTNIGAIGMRALENFFPHNLAFNVWYVVIPIVSIIIAIELIGISNFIKENLRKRM